MSPTDTFEPRVDAYITKSKPFAQPILTHVRELIHKACPGVVETIKWSRPFFEYKGAILCNYCRIWHNTDHGCRRGMARP